MAYITAEYYRENFNGVEIETSELTRLIDAASDAIDMAAVLPIKEVTENVRRATAYQVECLYKTGGTDAMHGFSSLAGVNERLGDYSVGGTAQAGSGSGTAFPVLDGIPISPFAIQLLRKDGLMRKCVYCDW